MSKPPTIPSEAMKLRAGQPPVIVPHVYPLQSIFDASGEGFTPLPGQGLLEQPVSSDGIVKSTRGTFDSSGFAVGNAPWSESPLAVVFATPSSGPIILRPGEVMTPFAHGWEGGFAYGLPFGWLGGGLVAMHVFRSPGTLPKWEASTREILFHRFRTVVRASSLTAPATGVYNLPTRFPWDFAYRTSGTKALQQNGDPLVSVQPTRMVLQLGENVALPAPPYASRLVFWNTDGFTAAGFWEFSWPANNATPGYTSQNPIVEVPDFIARLAANAGGMTVECAAGDLVEGVDVDVLRYGKL
ncbi:MAG: hypothetical protein KA310_03480 [Pseudomonadales bacterium]|nr:hypothetical protein [Pseudomonadales bacterium]